MALVININNCLQDYIALSCFCENLFNSKKAVMKKNVLQGQVFIYKQEVENMEKTFSIISAELTKNRLKDYNGEELNTEERIFVRVEHQEEDSTIAYMYLDALMHQYKELNVLLYTNSEQKEAGYSIWNKAGDFFCGPGYRSGVIDRVYGLYYSIRDKMWYIKSIKDYNSKGEHSKVNPIIELNYENSMTDIWKMNMVSLRNTNNSHEVRQLLSRCRSNFIDANGDESKKRKQYYSSIYESEEFNKSTENMPLFAFYLFCMQMHYLKSTNNMPIDDIKKIALNAWDIADGVLQLMENIRHSTEQCGYVHIRVHANKRNNGYLKREYGINDKKYPFYYEIRILDISKEGILDTFSKKHENAPGIQQLQVSDFFESSSRAEGFWSDYNRKEENMVHHYGLKLFSSIVSANEGFFRVISSSGYCYNLEKDTYSNSVEWNDQINNQMHLPGTEYVIFIPLRGREERIQIQTSVEADVKYKYDMTTDYQVRRYECDLLEKGAKKLFLKQEQKEEIINKLAKHMYSWYESESEKLQENQKMVMMLSMDRVQNFSSEIYCKAIVLCGIRLNKNKKIQLLCIINQCEGNQVVDFARNFAVFYSKACLSNYLSNMQIYLAGENEQLLITGRNLYELYSIISKIMLVKGIDQDTLKLLEYLVGQYDDGKRNSLENRKYKIVPFDVIQLSEDGSTLFEGNVKKTLNANLQKHSLGCSIKPIHMRIGSKIHLSTFFEAELLFHNNYYIVRFADLILKRLENKEIKQLMFVGYETYSELLLYNLTIEMRNKTKQKRDCHVSYMIYEHKTGGNFRYMEPITFSEKEIQFVIIVPINSSLTTHNKMRAALTEEMQHKEHLKKHTMQIIANYALILVRSSDGDTLDEMESNFWRGIDKKNRSISTDLIPESEPDVEYFVSVYAKWHDPLKCEMCYPQDCTKEKPLIETDHASIVPNQMIGLQEKELLQRTVYKHSEKNLQRVQALGDSLLYHHTVRNGNHYLYYFFLEKYFVQERKKIIKWLKKERNTIQKETDRIVYDIIVSPLHHSDAGFLVEVNHYLFNNAALVLHFDLDKQYRENVRTKYSIITGLYHNLKETKRKAVMRFHYVDDNIVSGRTYSRAKTLFQSLIVDDSEDIRVEVFSDVVVLLNRMSGDSVRNLMCDNVKWKTDEERYAHFHSYVNLNISSMRNHEDACTECKLVQNLTNLQNQSATNMQYNYWEKRIRNHLPRLIVGKERDEILIKLSKKKQAYRRMICTHKANEGFAELGYQKNDADIVRKKMIDLMEQEEKEQMEWIISYVKVFSRPFINTRKSNREAIFQIMLWMIDYIVHDIDKKRVARKYKEVKNILLIIKENYQNSCLTIYPLLLTLMKRLSDLGSNYVIRKDNMNSILAFMNKLQVSEADKERFHKNYISIVKRLCCQGSDESKSIFLEYILLYGEEYQLKKEEKSCIKTWGKDNKFNEILFLENTRVLNDGIVDLEKDVEKKNIDIDKGFLNEELKQYYYENFRRLLAFYNMWNEAEAGLTAEGAKYLIHMIRFYQYLKDGIFFDDYNTPKKDAEKYYKNLLAVIKRFTGAKKCALLYPSVEGDRHYRIEADGNVEVASESTKVPKETELVADTFHISPIEAMGSKRMQRVTIKYDIQDAGYSSPVFLQMDFSSDFAGVKLYIALKSVLVFRKMTVDHLQQDFSNNMLQKWSAKEYFNKQVMLQRASDHTDHDSLMDYFNQVLELGENNIGEISEDQKKRDRALIHMVINSYIARMNLQILAEVGPEVEPSNATFETMYKRQLSRLIQSLHVVEEFCVLDENGEEVFSNSLLDKNVRIRKNERGESLSFRRIAVIIAELILSAIKYCHKDGVKPNIYIYREGKYVVVKNAFKSKKGISKIKQDIDESLERKKDGISLATIKGTINKCYDLTKENGVVVDAEEIQKEKYFFVKLPILSLKGE